MTEIVFTDTETLSHDWLAGFKYADSGKYEHFHNDRNGLIEFLNKHRNDLFVGMNIRGYDQFIFHAIYSGLSPKSVSDNIINNGIKGYRMFQNVLKAPINFYDVMPTPRRSLKNMEAHSGLSIEETPIDFKIQRKLNKEELELFKYYNIADIDATEMIFNETQSDYEAQLGLINEFKLPLSAMGKTKVQLSATILGAKRNEIERRDEFDIELPSNLSIGKYGHIADWFLSDKSKPTWNYSKHKYEFPKYEVVIGKVKHRFAWGGLHCIDAPYFWNMPINDYLHQLTGNGYVSPFVMNMDVASYYPELAIVYELLSRNVGDYGKSLYRKIRDDRLMYKAQGNPLANPLKIVLNGTYGASISKESILYDAHQGRSICVYGQLFLLDLIEKVEELSELVNTNTDGIAIKPNSFEEVDAIKSVTEEWTKRTKMTLEYENLRTVYQKDVNNYIWVKDNGKVKLKGFYASPELLKCDQKIISEGVKNAVLYNKSAEETVNECNDLRLFQKVIDTGKYDFFMDLTTGQRFSNKVLRVFATNEVNHSIIRKGRHYQKTVEKVSYVPPKARVENGNIQGVPIPSWLDKQYYINAINENIEKLKAPKYQKTFTDFSSDKIKDVVNSLNR